MDHKETHRKYNAGLYLATLLKEFKDPNILEDQIKKIVENKNGKNNSA